MPIGIIVAWRYIVWTALVVALVVSAGWFYIHVKSVAKLNAEHDSLVEVLRNQHKEDLEAISALSQGLESMKRGYEALDKDRRRLGKEIERLKKDDEASRDYLTSPVPERVRHLYKASDCLQLPGTCKPDQLYDSGVPGDKH